MPRLVLTAPQSLVVGATLICAALSAADPADNPRPPEGPGAFRKGPGPGPEFGPSGPGGPDFGPGTFLAPQILAAADEDQDDRLTPEEAARAAERFVRESDTERKGGLDAESLGRAINRRIGPPPGFDPEGPRDDPAPDSPPGNFGPGTFLAPQLVELADADHDGRVSPEEAGRAADRFVREADRQRQGSLDSETLGQAMNRRMGPPPGFGPGGPMGQERKLVKQFDRDGDGRLNQEERREARESIKQEARNGGRGRRGFGPPPGFGPRREDREPPKPGPRLDPADVEVFPDASLYDPDVVRTLFLTFDDEDWEAELIDFHRTDVEVPATLIVDGRDYPGVGVHFRGLSSFGVGEGAKHSLNLSLDFIDPDQRLLGYKTLNLLNSHEDPSFLHTVLYLDLARKVIPAPKANFVRVVINGESWGLYVNAQQFDKVFLKENYPSGKGVRWKVPGSPGGRGGLDYLGEEIEPYQRIYQMKTDDGEKAWKDLIHLCRTLSETPTDRLEEALEPILDIDGALWFLALENALVNSDGYWVRASDYNIFRDQQGKFHLIPHDVNETFGPGMGPGFGRGGGPRRGPGGPGGDRRPDFGPDRDRDRGPGRGPDAGPRSAGLELDPLIGLDDTRKPLRSRLLAVPALRKRYLEHIRTIADEWLDWDTLGPIVKHDRSLIEKEVETDTRKLDSFSAFEAAVSDSAATEDTPGRGRSQLSLRAFAERRRDYLLNHPEIQKVAP